MNTEEIVAKINEQREKLATEHLAACERIRKKLELPPEALSIVDQAMRDGGRDLAHHAHHGPLPAEPLVPQRSPLRLVSENKIRRTDPNTGKPTAVNVRAQRVATRVEEIEILNNPDEWMVADVQVGMRSQFPAAGPPLPGRLFSPGGTCHKFVTDAIQTAMDFTMLVHYIGTDDDGAFFEAVAMGTHA